MPASGQQLRAQRRFIRDIDAFAWSMPLSRSVFTHPFGIDLSIGSDSNILVVWQEELRMLEYSRRLMLPVAQCGSRARPI